MPPLQRWNHNLIQLPQQSPFLEHLTDYDPRQLRRRAPTKRRAALRKLHRETIRRLRPASPAARPDDLAETAVTDYIPETICPCSLGSAAHFMVDVYEAWKDWRGTLISGARVRRPAQVVVDIVGDDQGIVVACDLHQLLASAYGHTLCGWIGEVGYAVYDIAK